jgi:cation:H+ antiporter
VPAWVVPAFVGGAVLSLVASSRLVRALEELGTHFGMPEVLLGLLVALAADGPELTSAVTAQLGGEHTIGVGVLFGSNVFNIAALLGLGSLIAGRVVLHRRVVVLEGLTALAITGAGIALVAGALGPVGATALTMTVFVCYVAVSTSASRLPLPAAVCRWLAEAVKEERDELAQAYPEPPRARVRVITSIAVLALLAVVAASALMERAASTGGSALGLPQVVVGGIVLAAVTSLPNAVAAVYLARAGKGAAMLSEAMNSNTINIVGGLVLPAVIGGLALGNGRHASVFAGASCVAMTALAALIAYQGRGIARRGATVLVGAYAAFLAVLVAIA